MQAERVTMMGKLLRMFGAASPEDAERRFCLDNQLSVGAWRAVLNAAAGDALVSEILKKHAEKNHPAAEGLAHCVVVLSAQARRMQELLLALQRLHPVEVSVVDGKIVVKDQAPAVEAGEPEAGGNGPTPLSLDELQKKWDHPT